MTLIRKDNPVGIDIVIDKIQTKLYSWLTERSGWTDYNSYHRAYLNPKSQYSNSLIPEFYTGDSEYREMYFNDNYSAESYIIVPPEQDATDGNGVFQADVWLIFQVNLEALYPSIQHRADEEAHRSVMLGLDSIIEEFDYQSGILTTVPKVYQGLDMDKIELTDMQKCHVFRINLRINYSYNC